MMFAPILAFADLRGNLIAAAVLLVIGVIMLRHVRPPSATTGSRRWLPIVAFIAGPLVAFLYTIADAIWVQPETYLNFAEYVETLIPVLTIGMIAGAVGAGAIWIGDKFTRHRIW